MESTDKFTECEVIDPWDSVIEESVKQLQQSEALSGKLRACLEYFHMRKKSGDPFPGIDYLKKKSLIAEEVCPSTHN